MYLAVSESWNTLQACLSAAIVLFVKPFFPLSSSVIARNSPFLSIQLHRATASERVDTKNHAINQSTTSTPLKKKSEDEEFQYNNNYNNYIWRSRRWAGTCVYWCTLGWRTEPNFLKVVIPSTCTCIHVRECNMHVHVHVIIVLVVHVERYKYTCIICIYSGTAHCRHLSDMDTWFCPNCDNSVQNYPWIKDTSTIRTVRWCPQYNVEVPL